MPHKIYEFNNFRVDISQKNLRKDGDIVPIQPKVFDVLAVLIEKNNELISRDDLMKAVWGETFVEESSLRLCIHNLRKIFDGNYIETVPKRGYRFNAEVREISPEPRETEKTLPVNLNETAPLKSGKSYQKYFIATVALISFFGIISTYLFWANSSNKLEKMTIAVLPFIKVGEKTEKNLPLANAIITQLSKLKDFRILPIDASGSNADAILQGSLQQENNVVKVSANLQNTTTKEIIWTENFDVKIDKEIGLETTISARLARLFSQKMVEFDDDKSAKLEKVSPEALNSYLSARKIWHARDLGRGEEMRSLLAKTINLEPNWALAHAANAEAFLIDDFTVTNYTKAEEVALNALEIDKNQVGALTVLGQVAINRDWDFAKAESFYRQAITLNPNYASTYHTLGKLLTVKRNFVESEKMLKKALEIEPFSPLFNTSLCESYYYDSKPDQALKQCEFALQLEPDFWLAKKHLFWIYVQKKMAKKVAEMVLSKYSAEEKEKLPFAKTLQEGSLEDYWRHYFANLRKSDESHHYTDSMMYIQLNETEKALDSLEKATEEKEWLAFRLNSDPIFEVIREEPRFVSLLKKINLKP
jgi:DNA-binding winged helix-turn-helix (wHTH) protein/tetratricopeptide (TPR) repeat protein